MHMTLGLEVLVLDRFQQYVEIVRESDEKCVTHFIGQFNDLKSKA